MRNPQLPILCFLFIFIITSCAPTPQQEEAPQKVLSSNENYDYGRMNPNAPKQIEEYGQLVGKWDVTISQPDSTNTWVESNATWVFKYILDGHAIQDYWINPSSASLQEGQNQFLGTNIRIYNPQLKLWQCSWLENQTHNMAGIWQSFMNDDDEIVLKDSTDTWQITFFNIAEQSFDWRWDVKQQDGSMSSISKIKATRVE